MAASVPLSSQSAALNSSLVFKCFVCSNVFSGDYKEQTKHFRLYRGFKTSGPCVQPICCGRNGCRDKFSSWNLLNRHVAQIHYQAALNNVSTHQQNENENVDDSNSLNTSISSDDDEHQVHHQQHHEEENQNDDQHQNEQGNTVVGNDSCRVVSAMMLDLRAHYQVSHEALNFMAEQLTKVLSSLPISQHHHSFNGSSQCNNPANISHINGITAGKYLIALHAKEARLDVWDLQKAIKNSSNNPSSGSENSSFLWGKKLGNPYKAWPISNITIINADEYQLHLLRYSEVKTLLLVY